MVNSVFNSTHKYDSVHTRVAKHKSREYAFHSRVQNYVDMFCIPGTQKKGSSVLIADMQDFTLQVLASTIVRLAGSLGLHMATRNQMRVVVDCFRGALYDWCSGIAPIMKRQLSDCKRGRRKNFSYASILVAFFERECQL